MPPTPPSTPPRGRSYADFEETHGNITEANKIYRGLINFRKRSPLVYIQHMRFARRAVGPVNRPVPSNITRDCPPFLLILQGITLLPF